MDMDDFVPSACAILEASTELLAAVQAQHTHIIVDEFQARLHSGFRLQADEAVALRLQRLKALYP